MTNVVARPPFARIQTSSVETADLNFQALERSLSGVFGAKVITHALSPYPVKSNDWLLLCDCTAGAITLTFPLASRADGQPLMVIKTDASANAVTLSGTFNGVVNPTLATQYQSKTINAGNGSYYFVPTITAADILSGTFPGNYVIAGTLNVVGNFSVNTSKFTVTASSGNTAIAGTLTVSGQVQVPTGVFLNYGSTNVLYADTGNTVLRGVSGLFLRVGAADLIQLSATGSTFNGTFNAAGDFSVGVAKFTVTASNGNTSVAGTLGVTSDFAVNTSKFTVTASSGNTSVAGTLGVTGNFAVNTSKFTVTASSGNTLVGGSLTVTGGVTIVAGTGVLTLPVNSAISWNNNSLTQDQAIFADALHNLVLQTQNTTAITIDGSQNTKLAAGLQLGVAFVAGAPAATGYVTLKDSTGSTYKVLVGT